MKKYLILCLLCLTTTLFAKEIIPENRNKVLFGLTLDLGVSHANLNLIGGYKGDDIKPGLGFTHTIWDILNISLNSHFLLPNDLLINAGVGSAGPYLMFNAGVGALRTVRNLPNNILRVGGSFDIRLGYSFFSRQAKGEHYPEKTLALLPKDNFVIGFEPSFYLTYNNFMFGIGLGAEYLIGEHITLIGSTKIGFMF